VTVREGFFEEIDFGDERFDVVSLRFVFEHVRHPRAVLHRAARLLEPGGAVFIDVPNLAAPFIGFDDFFSYGHLQTFVPATLATMCATEGLATSACEEADNLFVASPHPPSIRALLAQAPGPDPPVVDVNQVRALVERYHGEREAFMSAAAARLERATRGRRTVVYGAGTHSAEMWARCPFLRDRVIAFVDGNGRLQGHPFLGLPVHPPRDLPRLDPDVVLVSVRTAEAPIRQVLAEYGCADRAVTMYDATAAGVR
jgi:SAM-dependent methyltransferase